MAAAVPLGLAIRSSDTDWPLVLALAATLASLSRARLDPTRWVVARGPAMEGQWTQLDQELLDAVLSVAAPHRERLELLTSTVESERFAALVLTAAGHDISNQLHAATMAIGTMTRWSERLDASDQHRLAEAIRAIRRASSSLRDLVAIGASGPEATTTGPDIALVVRSLGSDIRVVGHNLTIEVCDRGPGLDPTHVETLFAPFAQLADDRQRRGSLGLGLFIARGLTESVGGTLEHHLRDGGGAMFVLRLRSVAQDPTERIQERVVLGPRPDRHPEAALEARAGREVADEDALSE